MTDTNPKTAEPEAFLTMLDDWWPNVPKDVAEEGRAIARELIAVREDVAEQAAEIERLMADNKLISNFHEDTVQFVERGETINRLRLEQRIAALEAELAEAAELFLLVSRDGVIGRALRAIDKWLDARGGGVMDKETETPRKLWDGASYKSALTQCEEKRDELRKENEELRQETNFLENDAAEQCIRLAECEDEIRRLGSMLIQPTHGPLFRENIELRKENEELKAQLDDTITATQLVMTANEELRAALSELWALKQLKDSDGKTPDYLERQPNAWKEAERLLGEGDD